MTSECGWTRHGVSLRDETGQALLALKGARYATRQERAAGTGPVVAARGPCAVTAGPADRAPDPAALAMVKAHCGGPYTITWQGRSWTAEVSSAYPLWRVLG